MIPLKWGKRREQYLREREQWMNELMQSGSKWSGRRKFLQMSAMAAGMAATKAFVPHSFQLVDVV